MNDFFNLLTELDSIKAELESMKNKLLSYKGKRVSLWYIDEEEKGVIESVRIDEGDLYVLLDCVIPSWAYDDYTDYHDGRPSIRIFFVDFEAWKLKVIE